MNVIKKYYLYSLVNGNLIDYSSNEIECLGDYYYEKYGEDYGVTTQLLVCKVDFENNKYEVVSSNDSKQYYANDRNMLVQYNLNSKMLCVINMDINDKYKFTFNDLPDTEFESVYICFNIESESNFLVCVTFLGNQYFNFFNIDTNKFTFEKFFEGEVWEVREYNGKLYIITCNGELLDEKGNVLIPSIYDDIDFYGNTQYLILKRKSLSGIANLENGKILIPVEYDKIIHNMFEECAIVQKDKKYGLIDLESGEIIFEPKYDEIIYEDNSFKAVLKKYTTYIKGKK